MTFTAVSVVGIGIFAAYGAVIGILQAFNYGSRQQHPARTLVLVTSQSPVGGD